MWTQNALAVCLFFILYYLITNPTDKEIFILFPLPGQHGAGKRRHDFVSGLKLRTEHTNNCNMKFLNSFFSNNHGLSLLLFFGYKSILDKCKISPLKIFHPKFLTNFDLIILFVFKISLLISYQYNMWTHNALIINISFLS
jgi:hypothetical protein